MKIHLFNLIFCLICFCSSASGQGIRTWYTDYDSAIRAAKREQKNLFIDTYTIWCIPCKRMNKVFSDKAVEKVINEHYITLKVDMDSPEGEKIKYMFQVVFLPTLIILNPDEEVLYKVDKEISASELVERATWALDPNSSAPDAEQKGTITESSSESDNKIIHILGDQKNGLDQLAFTRQEAYFRLELMDGSHIPAAERYLSTQDNWDTKENMQFILDFVNAPNTPMYDHIIAHRNAYDSLFSADQVSSTLMILIYKHLYKGIPRPTMDEAIQFYKDLRFEYPEQHARKYFITRTKLDKEHQKAYNLTYEYLTQHNTADEKALAKFITYVDEKKDIFSKAQLIKAAQLAEQYKLSTEYKVKTYPIILKLYQTHDECKKAKKIFKKLTSLSKSYKFTMPALTPQCDA